MIETCSNAEKQQLIEHAVNCINTATYCITVCYAVVQLLEVAELTYDEIIELIRFDHNDLEGIYGVNTVTNEIYGWDELEQMFFVTEKEYDYTKQYVISRLIK